MRLIVSSRSNNVTRSSRNRSRSGLTVAVLRLVDVLSLPALEGLDVLLSAETARSHDVSLADGFDDLLAASRRIAFCAARNTGEVFVADDLLKPAGDVARSQVMRPRLIVDALGKLDESVEIPCAQIELALSSAKVE